MNFFPLEILNVCMFLYVDLHDLGSPSEIDSLTWLIRLGWFLQGFASFLFGYFSICDKFARDEKGEIK